MNMARFHVDCLQSGGLDLIKFGRSACSQICLLRLPPHRRYAHSSQFKPMKEHEYVKVMNDSLSDTRHMGVNRRRSQLHSILTRNAMNLRRDQIMAQKQLTMRGNFSLMKEAVQEDPRYMNLILAKDACSKRPRWSTEDRNLLAHGAEKAASLDGVLCSVLVGILYVCNGLLIFSMAKICHDIGSRILCDMKDEV